MTDLLERIKTALADRYVVEREIGAGGMATVYRAQDLKHGRQVVVKVLRPELAAALGPERFLRELEITGGLSHPHILPLLDSGTADGFLYYVMPYLDGESLRQRLNREKQLPLEDTLRIVREVGDALSHAHKSDVIHCDIKPENILLVSGHAVVADFGIARAVSVAGGQRLSETGLSVGTPSYMSPEQATGDPAIDHRADIYAVGVLAYEMLAARPPFTGTTSQMVLAAHLTQPPEPVTKYRPAVPPALAQLVMKCLEKKAADRWQSAHEFLLRLEQAADSSGSVISTGAVPSSQHRAKSYLAVSILVVLGLVGFLVFSTDGLPGSDLPEAVVVGNLSGPLATAIYSKFLVVPSEDSPGLPLILGDDWVTSGSAERIASAFTAGTPVALVNGAESGINELRDVLGLVTGYRLPDGVSHADIYALDRDVDGNMYEAVFLPTRPTPPALLVVERGEGLTDTALVSDSYEEGPADRAARAQLFADWLGEDLKRDAPESDTTLVAGFAFPDQRGTQDPGDVLTDLAKREQFRSYFPFRSNLHQVITNVWGVHNKSTGDDLFYVLQEGIFAASSEVVFDFPRNKGRFTDLYVADTYVEGWTDNEAVNIEQQSPRTTRGQTDVTSSVSWALSGEVGFSSPSGNVGVNTGVSVNNSKTYAIHDVTVINQSGVRLNNAAWRFEIKSSQVSRGVGCIHAQLTPMTPVSRGTFQPTMQWIIRVHKAVREASEQYLPLLVTFETSVRHLSLTGLTCKLEEQTQKDRQQSGTMLVAWPPIAPS